MTLWLPCDITYTWNPNDPFFCKWPCFWGSNPPKQRTHVVPYFDVVFSCLLGFPFFLALQAGFTPGAKGELYKDIKAAARKTVLRRFKACLRGVVVTGGTLTLSTVSLGCCWGGHFLHLGLGILNNWIVYGCFNWMMNQTFTWEMLVSPNIHLKLGVEGSTSFLWFCWEVQMMLGTIATLPQIDQTTPKTKLLFHSFDQFVQHTPPKFNNIAPEKWWLEGRRSIPSFWGPLYIFPGYTRCSLLNNFQGVDFPCQEAGCGDLEKHIVEETIRQDFFCVVFLWFRKESGFVSPWKYGISSVLS